MPPGVGGVARPVHTELSMSITTATTSTDGILGMWREALLSADDALRVLTDDLRMLDDGLAVLTAQRETVSAQIAAILLSLDGHTTIPGIGELAIAPEPGSFDTHAIEALIVSLAATHPTIASELAACRSTAPRRLVVRVTRTTLSS